jgi:HAD superfamily hydrolase (TIGR01549 family)
MQQIPKTLFTWTIGKKSDAEDNSPRAISRLLAASAQLGVRYFCFDYFDTLVVREVQPEYTKHLASRLHSLLLKGQQTPEQLYSLRQGLELQLCQQRAATGGELECYMPDLALVYREALASYRAQSPLLPQDAAGFTELLLGIETAVEKAVQRPCQEVLQVLTSLRAQGFSTVLISDFYVPSPYFQQMLEHLNLLHLFDHVYVSADLGLAKGSGRIYEKIAKELRCTSNELFIVGDNPHSDIQRAKEKGLYCCQVINPRQQSWYQQWQPHQVYAQVEVRKRFDQATKVSKGLFQEMGTSLWLFTWKLLQQLLHNQICHVFFCSKEGEFLKSLFDQMQRALFGSPVIRSHYLLVSRKATFVASLGPLEEEDFSRLFAHYRDISLRDFLLSLNFTEDLACVLCEEAGLDFQTRLPNLSAQPAFAQLLALPSFQQHYEQQRQQQRKNFRAYLQSFDCPSLPVEGLHLVDVGWKGSIQDNIWHILEKEVALQGYYIGYLPVSPCPANNRKQGLLFDQNQGLPHFNVYNNNRSLFEMLLGASHGSADGYWNAEDFEYNQRQARNSLQGLANAKGAFVVSTLDLPEERRLFEEKIRPMQEQMQAEAQRLNLALLRSGCSCPGEDWFARRHARMVFLPSSKEIDFFESLYHLENFGIFEYTTFHTGTQVSWGQGLRNFINMRKNPGMLEMGIWPPILLRRLGLDWYRHINGRRRFRREFG